MCNRDQFEQFPPPRVFYPLSFDTHPNSFARIPFPLMLIQTAQGMAICVRTEAIAKRRTLLSRSFVTSFLFNRLRTLCTNQPLKKRRNSFVFFRFHTLGKMMGGASILSQNSLFAISPLSIPGRAASLHLVVCFSMLHSSLWREFTCA